MSTKWQRVKIRLPSEYTSAERQAIAQEIVDFIKKRSQDGLDKKGNQFKPYSPSYVKSLNFRIAGKSEGDVNLTLSGDMLGALDVIDETDGSVTIGYQDGTLENAIADGNIRGTYGKKSRVGPRRDFLGISSEDLQRILDRYPLDDAEARRARADELNGAAGSSSDVFGDGSDDGGDE